MLSLDGRMISLPLSSGTAKSITIRVRNGEVTPPIGPIVIHSGTFSNGHKSGVVEGIVMQTNGTRAMITGKIQTTTSAAPQMLSFPMAHDTYMRILTTLLPQNHDEGAQMAPHHMESRDLPRPGVPAQFATRDNAIVRDDIPRIGEALPENPKARGRDVSRPSRNF